MPSGIRFLKFHIARRERKPLWARLATVSRAGNEGKGDREEGKNAHFHPTLKKILPSL